MVGWQEGHLAGKNFCYKAHWDLVKRIMVVNTSGWAQPIYPACLESFGLLHEDARSKDNWRLRIEVATWLTWKMTIKMMCVLYDYCLFTLFIIVILVIIVWRNDLQFLSNCIIMCYRNFDFLIPDAPELIANFLDGEQDASCKRNAFMMLIHADQVTFLHCLYAL